MEGFGAEIIKELVAPAVMISACGLLCLSTNARMMSVLGRVRALHHERIEAYIDDPKEDPRRKEARAVRLVGLASQTEHMLHRLGHMRDSLMLLFGAIVLMLVCSALIGLSGIHETFGTFAVLAFAAGGVCMAVAMGISLHEMRIGLRAVRYEHERVLCLGECIKAELRGEDQGGRA